MTDKKIKDILTNGEGISVEFKEAEKNLPKNIFETICAFLNTEGGKILLGVRDDGTVSGVDPGSVNKIKSDLSNLSNNSQKLNPVFMLSAYEIEYKNKKIVIVQVPVSSLVHQCSGVIYARNEDGDYKVTQPEKIATIVNRKRSHFTEQIVYPYISLKDFKPQLFDRVKRLIQVRSPGHPWVELTADELLHRAGFYRKAPDGTAGYTLAAVLCFGKDETIQSIVPAYKIDALVRKQNLNRYDDRLTVRTNLIDVYDLLMAFIAKHLDDPFYLEGDVRVSLRDKIFRELIANIIAHREYLDARPATIIIYKYKVVFTNPNNPHGKGIINPSHFTPFPKNPVISKFLIQIGRVEEIGSGIRNVNKYLPIYSKGSKSEFIEDDLFTTNIYLKSSKKAVTPQPTPQPTPQVERLISIFKGEMRKKQLMNELKLKDWKYFLNAYLKTAIGEGFVEMTIPDQPNHPNQKYRLTEKGKTLNKELEKQNEIKIYSKPLK